MKKLFQWLTGSVVKEIGNAIDKLTTTEEEKLIIKKQVSYRFFYFNPICFGSKAFPNKDIDSSSNTKNFFIFN